MHQPSKTKYSVQKVMKKGQSKAEHNMGFNSTLLIQSSPHVAKREGTAIQNPISFVDLSALLLQFRILVHSSLAKEL
jgi:hypothetical protein